MKRFLLTTLALAPLFAHAGAACCGDLSAFAEKGVAAGTHVHGENPRVVLSELQRQNLGIRTEKIAPAKIAQTVFALGEIEADPRGLSAVASRIPGRLVELRVTAGDRVKTGDTVAVVEARQAGDTPARIPLVALADGTVDEVLVRLGDPVSPDAPILRLADHTRLVAIARIPQRHAATLKPTQTRARMTPEGASTREVVLAGFAPHADSATGTLIARFPLENTTGDLTPGRRAEFRVLLSEKSHPLTVPRSAIQGDKGDLFVFVENAPGVYEKHPIVLGDGDDLRVAITGPEAGEAVVTHGAGSLRYAEAGALSLKDAMDAAHGHAHGPNGEELGTGGGTPAMAAPHRHADGTLHTGDHAAKSPATHKHEDGTPCTGNHDTSPAKPNTDADHDDDLEYLDPLKDLEAATNQAATPPAGAHRHADGSIHAAPHTEPAPAKSAAPGEAPKSQTAKFFTGSSAEIFLGTLAVGEAILLALAVSALRRREQKEADHA